MANLKVTKFSDGTFQFHSDRLTGKDAKEFDVLLEKAGIDIERSGEVKEAPKEVNLTDNETLRSFYEDNS